MILSTHGIIGSSVTVASGDADALAFFTAAGITDTTQKSAVNTLVTDLKAANIWTKMKALYPFVGGTAAQHRFNLKDPRTVSAAFYLDFIGGMTHSSLGVIPNGTTSYANPFFTGTTFTSVNNAHISYYSQTSTETNVNATEAGCYDSVDKEVALIIRRPNSMSYGVLFNETYYTSGTNTDARGLSLISRTANNSLKHYKNNTIFSTATGINASSSLPSNNVFLFTSGNLTNNADGLFATNKISSFISLGDGLTDTEAANFYTAVQNYNTTLNRQV